MDGIGNSAAVQQSKPFAYQDFDLTNAIVNRLLTIPGENLYCDQYSTGTATVRMNAQNNIESAPILVASGTQINGKFTSFVLDSPAQAGKVLRLIIGAPNYFVKPASQTSANPGVVSISGNVSVLDSPGITAQLATTVSASAAVGTDVVTLFTPAQNPNGIILRSYWLQATAGAGASSFENAQLIACTGAAPTTYGTNRAAALELARTTSANAIPAYTSNFGSSRRIPAGWGVYLITQVFTVAGSVAVLSATWEVL